MEIRFHSRWGTFKIRSLIRCLPCLLWTTSGGRYNGSLRALIVCINFFFKFAGFNDLLNLYKWLIYISFLLQNFFFIFFFFCSTVVQKCWCSAVLYFKVSTLHGKTYQCSNVLNRENGNLRNNDDQHSNFFYFVEHFCLTTCFFFVEDWQKLSFST